MSLPNEFYPKYKPIVLDQTADGLNNYDYGVPCCVAQALCTAKEVMDYHMAGVIHKFSYMWLYGNPSVHQNEQEGANFTWSLDILKNIGVPFYYQLPYVWYYNNSNAPPPTSQNSSAKDIYNKYYSVLKYKALKNRITSWSEVYSWTSSSSLTNMKQHIYEYGSILICIKNSQKLGDGVGNDGIIHESVVRSASINTLKSYDVNSSDSIYMPSLYRYSENPVNYNRGASNSDGQDGILSNHCMACVGWKIINGKLHWIIQNTWSKWWGDDGYCYLPYDYEDIIRVFTMINSVNNEEMFTWEASKITGKNFQLTASEWNKVIDLVNLFEKINSQSFYINSSWYNGDRIKYKVTKGDSITANKFYDVTHGLWYHDGHDGVSIDRVNSGDKILASYFESINHNIIACFRNLE